MSYIHKGRPWLKNVLKASKTKYSLYTYGCESIEANMERFFERGLHTVKPFHKDYAPNPFCYQYDLEMHLFLNYEKLQNQEIMRVKRRWEQTQSEEDLQRLEFVRRNGATGIKRYEHIFNAAEIRWPTIEQASGALKGSFIRDPWAIRRMEALSDKNPFTVAFGGGGQGKTWTFLGFMLMIFEHFLYTRNGAKCSFSTISEDKIKNVPWPHLLKLLDDTERDISLYAGKSIPAGGYTLKRPGKGKSDTGGVFRGILVGRNINDSVVTDKLTGTHMHEAYCYLVDEIQNTPKAPLEAASNYMSSGRPVWIPCAGNYDRDDDGLGPNAQPLNGGWESVTPETGKWESEMVTGAKATVIHFNNELSPGMTKEGERRFPHLPNRTKRDKIYPPGKCTLKNKAARRFWFGWRSTDIDEDRVLTNMLVRDGQANLDLELDREYPVFCFGSLDPAESGGDRNLFAIFADGMEKSTEQWVWGLKELHSIEAPADPRKNQNVITNEVIKICKKHNVKADNGVIIDGTKNTGHSGKFAEKGFNVISLIYHKALPDGKREDKHTRKKHTAILVNPNAPSDSGRYAHQLCVNHITFCAYLLKEYVSQGVVRGINDNMLAVLNENRTLEEEMFRRSFLDKTTTDYGGRYCLDSKEDFKESYKFSPDLLDLWFHAAYYMFVVRGMPLYEEVVEVKKAEAASGGSEKKRSYIQFLIDSENLLEDHADALMEDEMAFFNENY